MDYEKKEEALAAYEHFIDVYEEKFPKAVEFLKKDKDVLFTFYVKCDIARPDPFFL